MDTAYNIFRDCDSNSDSSENSNHSNSVYIFGYGSLIWNPGFEYAECLTGCMQHLIKSNTNHYIISLYVKSL